MSWDVLIFKAPPGVTSFAQLPEGYLDHPVSPLGSLREVQQFFMDLMPELTFAEPTYEELSLDGCSVEIYLGKGEDQTSDQICYIHFCMRFYRYFSRTPSLNALFGKLMRTFGAVLHNEDGNPNSKLLTPY